MLVQFFLDPNVGNLKIRQPGAVHHARFMAQSIYYMKLNILSDIVKIGSTANIKKKEIDAISEFVALFYAKWFLKASVAVISPRSDLEAISEMIAYKECRPQIASKCLESMENHTWYLHPSLIGRESDDVTVTSPAKINKSSAYLNNPESI